MRNIKLLHFCIATLLKKQFNNLTIQPFNTGFTPIQSGFTLIEILIVISIIGVTAAAAVPGLRKFGDDQKLDAASSNILQVIKQAQSSAKSGVRCANGYNSTKWTLDLRQNIYSLRVECSSGNLISSELRIPDSPYSSNDLSLVSILESNCGIGIASVSAIFTKSGIKRNCYIGGLVVESEADISLTLQNNKKTSQKVLIDIERSGIFRKAPI